MVSVDVGDEDANINPTHSLPPSALNSLLDTPLLPFSLIPIILYRKHGQRRAATVPISQLTQTQA